MTSWRVKETRFARRKRTGRKRSEEGRNDAFMLVTVKFVLNFAGRCVLSLVSSNENVSKGALRGRTHPMECDIAHEAFEIGGEVHHPPGNDVACSQKRF